MEEKLYNFKDKEYTEAQLQQVADSKKISLDDLFAKNPSISAVENTDIDKSENLGSEKDSNNKNLKEEEEDLYSRGVYATFKNKDLDVLEFMVSELKSKPSDVSARNLVGTKKNL